MSLNNNVHKNLSSKELQIEINSFEIITAISPNCYTILGYYDSELLNTTINKYFDYSFTDFVNIKELQTEIQRKDQTTFYSEICVTDILFIDNKATSITLSIIDISKYKMLKERENMIFNLLENVKDIVCRFQLIPEPKFIYLNHSVTDMLGYSFDDYKSNPMLPFEITHPDDYEKQLSKIKSDTDFSKLIQVRMKHKDGHYVWLEDYIIPIYDKDGELIGVDTISRNIQERKELEQRLERLGYHDDLTGLFNKNYFLKEMNLLDTTINIPIGILVCDLDNLKHINDVVGHLNGDSLLKNTGKILKSIFHSENLVSRTGGDEFVIFVKNTSHNEVKTLYNELQNAISQYNENTKGIPIEISIGLAYSETCLNSMEYTLNIADKEMYTKKKIKKENNVIL